MASEGYFRVPNRLLIEGCARPVALAVYAHLAATPRIWTARGVLQPFEVRASRAALVNATGASPKQVRGALAWLIRRGFVVRLDTSEKTTAAFRVVTGAKIEPNGTPTRATTYADTPPGEGPSPPEKGQEKGQDGAKPKLLHGKDLQGRRAGEGPR